MLALHLTRPARLQRTLQGEEEDVPGNDLPSLIPLENRHVSLLSVKNEWVLHINYDISNSVRLNFQHPTSLGISGGDISVFERMFMAGLRLSFLDIA